MADGYRKQFLKELGPTDVSEMTAAEVEQMILQIRAKRLSRQKQSAAFNAARQQEVQYAGKVHAEWQKEAQQAAKDAGTASKFGTYQSHYGPPMREYSTPGRYVPAYGGPFGGYGWGLFW
jgi:hypothetical protein